jgi:lipoprotein-anchoring transpeptidase ErfK/SrfK
VERKSIRNALKKVIALAVALVTISVSFYTPAFADEVTDEIGFNYTTKTVYTGKSFKLVLNNAPKKIKWWASADTSIASVDKNGVVTGVGAGVCKVKAKCNEIKYTCVVTVIDPYIKASQNYVRVGSSATIKVKGDKVKSYTSSDPDVLSVTKDGTVTANSKGKATITALCKSGKEYTLEMNAYQNIKYIENPTFDDLAPTTHMTFEELVGDSGEAGYPDMMPAPDTYKIIVDLYWKVVLVYTKDSKGEYTIPVRYMRCTVGVPGRTRTGTFKMLSTKNRFAHFNVGGNAQYWSLIVSATYFHSILYDAIDANTWTKTSWENLGNAVSHGCIRLPVPDARWIYYNAAPGTVVTIRSGSKNDTETKAISDQLVLAKAPEKRPNLKKGEIPWTDNWTIEEVPQEVKFVRYEQGSGK